MRYFLQYRANKKQIDDKKVKTAGFHDQSKNLIHFRMECCCKIPQNLKQRGVIKKYFFHLKDPKNRFAHNIF